MKLRISQGHYREMRKATALSFYSEIELPPETGCVLIVGRNGHEANSALLVKEVLIPDEGDFSEQESMGLTFSSRFLRKALLRVRELGLAGFLTVHTHPLSERRVGFSRYDDANDPELMRNLYDLEPDGVFGSLVLGSQAIAGRLWFPDFSSPTPLHEMVVVGEGLEFIPLDGMESPPPPAPSEIFDRGLAVSGAGALARISKMRMAVVGASGTGSLTAELLVRAGAGKIILFEFDRIERVNLNRILHSRVCDAKNHRSKAERQAEALREIGMPSIITTVEGNITENEIARELRGCDIIFGCVDASDWARLVMTEVSYQYLIPYIDLGTEIGLGESGVQSLDARVSLVTPDRACLLCSGMVSEERLRLEGLAPEEKRRILAMGYSKDAPLHAPAVMDLNMRAASLATLVLRHLLQPFLDAPLPAHIKESVTNFNIRKVTAATREECHICGAGGGRLGYGDARRLTTTAGAKAAAAEAEPALNSINAS